MRWLSDKGARITRRTDVPRPRRGAIAAVLRAHPRCGSRFARPGEFALFRIGKAHLGLLQSKKVGMHLEVNTPDVDEFHEELIAAGVEAVSPPRDRPWGERTFTVRDPDGNLIEFQ